jgi:lipoprotein-releasing system ATP-binding protein
VELPLLLAGIGGGKCRQQALGLLEAVGLRGKAHGQIHTLSGGEQQRLALCVALVTEPRLLLADELTGELDTGTSLAVFDLLKRLSVEPGLSVLVVTHDLAIAQRTDRVVRIVDGRIATQSRRGASELVSIDERGMIQLPRDLMIESGIDGHARVKVVPEGLLIEKQDPDGT